MLKIFSSPAFQLMKKGLDYTHRQHELIANNVANIETPGYKGKRLKFQEALDEVAGKTEGLALTTTNARHINKVSTPEMPRTATLKQVNIDTEMTELAKNTIQYNTFAEIINRKESGLKALIRDAR